MGKRIVKVGICHLCKKNTELSFEHIPPKVAFNSQTKYRTVPFIQHVEQWNNPDYKPSGKIMQGGMDGMLYANNAIVF